MWLVVLGGKVQPEKKTINGVDKWEADYVSSPNTSIIIELREYYECIIKYQWWIQKIWEVCSPMIQLSPSICGHGQYYLS